MLLEEIEQKSEAVDTTVVVCTCLMMSQLLLLNNCPANSADVDNDKQSE